MHRPKLFTPWILIFLVALAALPVIALAQSTPKFSELTVELWPEYDRPDVLVIYRATLSSDTSLPATITFRFPARIEDLHAVAVERNGGLFNLPSENVQQERSGDELLLTVTTDSPNIHLEYYDAGMLTKEGDSRQLDYSFVSDYPIEAGRFQVQLPLEAQDLSMTPAPSNSFTDSNGFSYQAIEPTGLAAGDTVELNASYQRGTDAPSVQFLPPSAPASAPQQPAADVQLVTDEAPGSTNFSLGYILIGVGVALMLATGGYWWWSTRHTAPAAGPAQRGPQPAARRQKRPGGSKARPRATSDEGGGYCYQCGTALRPDARFCHVCGAERRKG